MQKERKIRIKDERCAHSFWGQPRDKNALTSGQLCLGMTLVIRRNKYNKKKRHFYIIYRKRRRNHHNKQFYIFHVH